MAAGFEGLAALPRAVHGFAVYSFSPLTYPVCVPAAVGMGGLTIIRLFLD